MTSDTGSATDDFLELVEREHARASRRALRLLILQPGALGDCLLTLPLVQHLQILLGVGGVDLVGHMENLQILPGRSVVAGVRSLETLDLHRLFVPARSFEVRDPDPLVQAFADYAWIVSFLGEPDSDFERNLAYAVHCSHGAEILTLSQKPPADYPRHVTAFHLEQVWAQSPTLKAGSPPLPDTPTLRSRPQDEARGRDLLRQLGLASRDRLLVIHPGSGGPAKCWHPDNFRAIADAWQRAHGPVLFVVGPVEQERWSGATLDRLQERAPLLVAPPLEDTLALLTQADAVLTNDSGVGHLAAGLGRRTVVVFGPTAPHQYRPVGPHVQAVHQTGGGFAETPCPATQHDVLTRLRTASR